MFDVLENNFYSADIVHNDVLYMPIKSSWLIMFKYSTVLLFFCCCLFLFILPVTERCILKSPTMIANIWISSYFSVKILFIYFGACYKLQRNSVLFYFLIEIIIVSL